MDFHIALILLIIAMIVEKFGFLRATRRFMQKVLLSYQKRYNSNMDEKWQLIIHSMQNLTILWT